MLTRRNLLDIDNVLAQIEHVPGDRRFTLAVARLRARVLPVVAAIRAQGRLPDALAKQYMDYDAERLRLSRAWALKDDHGQPVQDATGTFVLRSTTDFERDLRTVQESEPHRGPYREVEQIKAQWNAWVEEPADELGEAPLPTIPFDVMPPQVTAAHLRPLLPVLDGVDETTDPLGKTESPAA